MRAATQERIDAAVRYTVDVWYMDVLPDDAVRLSNENADGAMEAALDGREFAACVMAGLADRYAERARA